MEIHSQSKGFSVKLKSLEISQLLILLISAILSGSVGEKLVIKSYDSGACIHVSGKNVSVQPCVWKPHNSTKKPYQLSHELLSIHQFDMEDDLNSGASSSSEENTPSPILNQSYYLIRVRQSICLVASDHTITAGKCRFKRSKFLIRSGSTVPGSSFKFTIETPGGKCLTWDGTGTQLYQRSCHLRGLHKLWIFCKEEGDCGMDPSHPTWIPVRAGGQKVTSTSTSAPSLTKGSVSTLGTSTVSIATGTTSTTSGTFVPIAFTRETGLSLSSPNTDTTMISTVISMVESNDLSSSTQRIEVASTTSISVSKSRASNVGSTLELFLLIGVCFIVPKQFGV